MAPFRGAAIPTSLRRLARRILFRLATEGARPAFAGIRLPCGFASFAWIEITIANRIRRFAATRRRCSMGKNCATPMELGLPFHLGLDAPHHLEPPFVKACVCLQANVFASRSNQSASPFSQRHRNPIECPSASRAHHNSRRPPRCVELLTEVFADDAAASMLS